MGFPNVDIYLADLFLERFTAVQADPAAVIDDLFENFSDKRRREVATYVTNLRATDDIKERGGDKKHLYLLPHFPVSDLAFPQVGISLGAEDPADRVVGDHTGQDAVEVHDIHGTLVGWDQTKGYYASGSWDIDVVCDTKPEAVWLSRFCQYFICQALQDLTVMGVLEVGVSLKDLRLEDRLLQPNAVFNRGLRVTAGKVVNTWKQRIPVTTYAEGVNKAI